jgi:hypothetical protein
LGHVVLAHVLEARPKYDTSYFIRVVPAHSARRAMNSPLTKKAGKYFIFTGIFEPT